MVYDWDGKEDDCFRIYVEENGSLDDVMKYMKEKYNFEPSKRAFQVQFKRWDFPNKHASLDNNTSLVDRIRQLWQDNVVQKDMASTLKTEGYDISSRQLYRIRARNGWLLRGSKEYQETVNGERANVKRRRTTGGDSGVADANILPQDAMDTPESLPNETSATPQQPLTGPLPSVDERQVERRQQFQQRSDELWASRKRRRRTRGYGGLGADPPGPPRFPSETTLDESKAFLHLSNEQYTAVRDQFQSVCEAHGVLKKTTAGPEKWKAVQDQLVSDNEHLQREFYGAWNGVPEQSKRLALDVICLDVTKRMRSGGRKMTIVEAKNTLGINPSEAREVRAQFYNILKRDNFVSKIEAGTDHWNQLKQQWFDESHIVQQVLTGNANAQPLEEKNKAIEVLCRDVMKRFRDDLNKADPSFKKQINMGPGPGPVHGTPGSKHGSSSSHAGGGGASHTTPTPRLLPLSSTTTTASAPTDPALPPHDPSLTQPADFHPATGTPTLAQPIAALFRLHAASTIRATKQMFLTTISHGSLEEITQLANAQYGGVDGRTVIVRKVEGVVANAAGAEASFAIQSDAEMAAYLGCVGAGRVVFVLWVEGLLE